MPINSNERQNANFSQEKKPMTKINLKRPTVRHLSRTNKAPSAKVK